MPRYFFHVKRGQVTVLDQEGIDLENSAQAEEEAVRRTQQCLADDALNGMPISRGISSGMIIVAAGKLMRTIMAGLAEFERDLIRDRVMCGRRLAVKHFLGW
jgi:hypothetical protein